MLINSDYRLISMYHYLIFLYIYNASSSVPVERKDLQSGLMLESMQGSGFLMLLQCGLLTGWGRLLKNYTFSVCFSLFVIVQSELFSCFFIFLFWQERWYLPAHLVFVVHLLLHMSSIKKIKNQQPCLRCQLSGKRSINRWMLRDSF